mmetsp:Transcript_47390/g.87079  ORF Transcript_47390/g.87079 Transcript_47390/m.87079 type:complete len:235 (-) Transcript_47390:629-1333(-)
MKLWPALMMHRALSGKLKMHRMRNGVEVGVADRGVRIGPITMRSQTGIGETMSGRRRQAKRVGPRSLGNHGRTNPPMIAATTSGEKGTKRVGAPVGESLGGAHPKIMPRSRMVTISTNRAGRVAQLGRVAASRTPGGLPNLSGKEGINRSHGLTRSPAAREAGRLTQAIGQIQLPGWARVGSTSICKARAGRRQRISNSVLRIAARDAFPWQCGRFKASLVLHKHVGAWQAVQW